MRMFSSLVSNECGVLQINCVLSSVLMVRIVKTVVFWVVILCSLWRIYSLFRGTCRLQERCSVKCMGGGGVIGPVVNRKCKLHHFLSCFFTFSAHPAVCLIRLYSFFQSHGSDSPFFLKPFCVNRRLPHPFHFSVILDLICLFIYLNLYLPSGKLPCKEIQKLVL